MMAIGNFYLGASPSAPINSAPFSRPQSMSQATLPSPANQASQAAKANNRQSMPPPSRTAMSPPATSAQAASAPRVAPIEPTPEEPEEESDSDDDVTSGRARKGTMSKDFRFPSTSSEAPPPVPALPADAKALPKKPRESRDSREHQPAHSPPRTPAHQASDTEEVALTPVVVSSVEVPPPPPVEKERSPVGQDIGDEEVGDTEEISLN